jgi:hypothetical protein
MNATPILPGLSPVAGKPLTASFDAGRLSSDGGMIVLREIATRLGLAQAITARLRDERDHTRVQHSYAEMVEARMLMIAAGYEDCDDIDALRADPALKIACGRCPVTGADLMSQPTLSGEPCRLACAGPHRARPDRSLLPQLRPPAAAHRARHRRHR